MTHHHIDCVIPWLLVGLLTGCGAYKTVNIGNDKSAASLADKNVSTGNDPDAGSEPKTVNLESLPAYVGSWDGYTEAYKFSDGSDRIRLTLNADGTGTLRAGDAELFPVATDPRQSYPPGAVDSYPQGYGLYPGFGFSVAIGMVDSKRINLSAAGMELYAAWCQLQTPVKWEDNGAQLYSCVRHAPPGSSCSFPGPADCMTIGCAKKCQCDAVHCEAAMAGSNIELDAALDSEGQELVGTLVDSDRIQVRMTRQ